MRLIDADTLPIKFDGHTFSVWKNDLDAAPTINLYEWISVEDRLPEKYLDDEGIELNFIVWSKGYIHSQTAYFNGKIFYFRCYDGTEGIMDGISHWMPVPAPPTE